MIRLDPDSSFLVIPFWTWTSHPVSRTCISQCMKSDGKSTRLWASTLGQTTKPASQKTSLDYLPSLAFLDNSHWWEEDNLLTVLDPYRYKSLPQFMLADFIPYCARSDVNLTQFFCQSSFWGVASSGSFMKRMEVNNVFSLTPILLQDFEE